MIAIPASLRSDFIHIAGMTIHIALESTIHIIGIVNRIGTLLGLTENDSLTGLGVGLILFATALAFSARRSELKLPEASVAVALDFAWVLGSYVILFLVPFSTHGKWLIAAIADIVLAFGILQWVGIYRIRNFRQQREV